MYLHSGGAFAAFLLARYYTPMRYPFVHKFECYYVRSIELSEDLERVKLRYVMVRQKPEIEVGLRSFKQLHMLKH